MGPETRRPYSSGTLSPLVESQGQLSCTILVPDMVVLLTQSAFELPWVPLDHSVLQDPGLMSDFRFFIKRIFIPSYDMNSPI